MGNTVKHRGFRLAVALAAILAVGQTKAVMADTSALLPTISAEGGLRTEINSLWSWLVSTVEGLTGTALSSSSTPECPTRICGGGGGGGNPDR